MGMEDVQHVVHLLHTALHLPSHHILKERELLQKLDGLKQELTPMEKVLFQTTYRHTLFGVTVSVMINSISWYCIALKQTYCM